MHAVVLGACVLSMAHADELHVVPTLLTQADFFGQSASAGGESGFSFARFRPGIRARPTSWAQVVASAEWARSDKPVILDGYVLVSAIEGFALTIGHSKNPLFVSGRNESEGTMPFPEPPMPVHALWPSRDMGVDVFVSPPTTPLEAWFRVSNGKDGLTGNDNPKLAYSVRLDGAFGRAKAHQVAQFGLRLGMGLYFEDSALRDGITGRLANDFAFGTAPPVQGPRRIEEGHALVYVGPVRALAEIGFAHETRPDHDGLTSQGWAAELAWMITGQRRTIAAWPNAELQDPFRFDRVALEIATRVERLAVAQGARDVQAYSAMGASIAATMWLSSFFSLAFAGYRYDYDSPPANAAPSWLVQARATVFVNAPTLER